MDRTTAARYGAAALLAAGGLGLAACADEPTSVSDAELLARRINAGGPRPALADYSVTPALVKGLPSGVKAYSIISSDDVLPGSPNFVFGGSADGTGLIRNADGTFTMLVNHEDNFAVSRVTLDGSFRPVRGEYLLNSDAGVWRLCSATLATPEEHGFGPLFITAGESGSDSQIHGVDPFGAPRTASPLGSSFPSSTILSAFGYWSTENAVPLPRTAYGNRTVVVIGDDDSSPSGGQVALYVGAQGDLQNGNLYVMARPDGNVRERDFVVGQRERVVFKQIANQKSLTADELQEKVAELGAIQFGRVEDIDYRKTGPGREVYFNVTGQNNTGSNADYSRTKYGRVYKLVLDPRDPTSGWLEVVLDGDDRSGPARMFQNPDNILVTRNYAYIQEDPNGYRDETHDAYIYQYDLEKKTLRVVMELDHRRDEADAAKYNVFGPSRFGQWEYGAMLDVSHQLGGNGNEGTFLIAVQPHTWRDAKYAGVDGGSVRPNENQASQMILVTGLPR